MKLGMLGMWHSHADGIVRRVAENPDEFTLVGFYDPDPAVVADRRKQWEPRLKDFRVFDRPEQLLAEIVSAGGRLVSLNPIRETLEELFIERVSGASAS